MNKVLLSGRIANDIKLLENKSERKYAFITLAVDSDKSKDTYFISITANEKQAEVLAQYAKKGSAIEVVAWIKTQSTGEGSERKTSTYIIMEEFHFIKVGRKPEDESAEGVSPNAPVDSPKALYILPPQAPNPAAKTTDKKTIKKPSAPAVDLGEVVDDELPF